MLRVFKPTSPLSVGSFILAPFSACATAALGSRVTGWFPGLGRLSGAGAAALGPALATYTAALFGNTVVPAWHEVHRELPFVFGGSGAAAGGGLAMVLVPVAESGPARRLAVGGAVVELAATEAMVRRYELAAEPYRQGRSGRLMSAARALTVSGVALSLLGRGSRVVRGLAGAAFLAGSVTLRFGVFEAGLASARDPKYTVVPQRERLRGREHASAKMDG
jgi:hypothetical protein